jgi:trans-aconitate methyltransferase
MAKRFPNAEVIGVDVSPVPLDPDSVPPNCRFEIDDIQLGLTHFEEPSQQFDLIHARVIARGIKNFRRTLRDVQRCLKPGGCLIWIEPDYELFTPDIHVYQELGSQANPGGTWAGRVIFGKSYNIYTEFVCGAPTFQFRLPPSLIRMLTIIFPRVHEIWFRSWVK